MVGITISMVGISIGISISISVVSISISISTTLATGNMLERVSSRVELADTMDSTIVRKTKGNSITIGKVAGFSTTLAKTLRGTGNKRSSSTRVGSNSGKTITIDTRVSIGIGKVSRFCTSLSTAAETSGG